MALCAGKETGEACASGKKTAGRYDAISAVSWIVLDAGNRSSKEGAGQEAAVRPPRK